MYRHQDALDAQAHTYARVVADRRRRDVARARRQRATSLVVVAMLLIGLGLAVRRWQTEWAEARRPVYLVQP